MGHSGYAFVGSTPCLKRLNPQVQESILTPRSTCRPSRMQFPALRATFRQVLVPNCDTAPLRMSKLWPPSPWRNSTTMDYVAFDSHWTLTTNAVILIQIISGLNSANCRASEALLCKLPSQRLQWWGLLAYAKVFESVIHHLLHSASSSSSRKCVNRLLQ